MSGALEAGRAVLEGRGDGTYCEAEAAIRSLVQEVEAQTVWRCFHCDQTFADRAAAAAHFGADEGKTPACQIKASEGGLLQALREAEDDAERAWSAVHAESAEGIEAMRRNLGRHRVAVTSAEESGYERGLADRERQLEILRRALAWHGDRTRMATTREDWQQEIDEALRWVADNPEADRPSFPTMYESLRKELP